MRISDYSLLQILVLNIIALLGAITASQRPMQDIAASIAGFSE